MAGNKYDLTQTVIMSSWQVRFSNSKQRPYFFNADTQESVWDPPADLSKDQISSLPGAEYLTGGVPGKVRASHLLVKHSGSRRPSSWKEQNITRSKDEAIDILKSYQAEINGSPEKFAALATEHSDCGSHANAGDLGWFGKGEMQKPFEETTYSLKAGEMSDIITTDSGVHIILRTG